MTLSLLSIFSAVQRGTISLLKDLYFTQGITSIFLIIAWHLKRSDQTRKSKALLGRDDQGRSVIQAAQQGFALPTEQANATLSSLRELAACFQEMRLAVEEMPSLQQILLAYSSLTW